ncbi:hypothetical protein, partial [Vibrio mimicus]|uniref:hypothetical protein n=1 Tax=Vibrio mimicus TaxID=674 RepID=UPI001CA36657
IDNIKQSSKKSPVLDGGFVYKRQACCGFFYRCYFGKIVSFANYMIACHARNQFREDGALCCQGLA